MKLQLILFCLFNLISFATQDTSITCEDIKEPSKEECTGINELNSECCYLKEDSYFFGEDEKCELYPSKLINYGAYEDDELKDLKMAIVLYYLEYMDESGSESNIAKILNDLEKGGRTIECKEFAKTLDFSKITYTSDDIKIAKNERFCGKLMMEDSVNKNQCLNGIVFSDLKAKGEKCCYAEYKAKEHETELSTCISLSKTQIDNIDYLKSLIPEEDAQRDFTGKVVCDGFEINYDSVTDKYTRTDYSQATYFCSGFLKTFILNLLLMLISC